MAIAPRNVGRLDQAARIGIGLVLVGFALWCPWAASLGPWVTWPSGIIGVVLIVTGLTRRCPGYAAVGADTGG